MSNGWRWPRDTRPMDERKDHHHHVLGDADAVAVGHLGGARMHPLIRRDLASLGSQSSIFRAGNVVSKA